MRTSICYAAASLLVLAGCAGPPVKPDWVSGSSPRYAPKIYLTGVGAGDTRKAAEDTAYGAISRIFTAEIDQKTREWESYLQEDSGERTSTFRSIEIKQVTGVSTAKTLENVRIAEVWQEMPTKRFYALAVLDRRQTAEILRDRIGELDARIETFLSDVGPATPKIRAARNLYQAVKTLLVRDVINTDLRIIEPSGQGMASAVSASKVTQNLYNLTRQQLNIALEVSGPRNDEIRTALIEGLNLNGFVVLKNPSGSAPPAVPDLLIRANVGFQPVSNPRYRLVRWTAEFEVVDTASGKVIGGFSKSGREGQLSLAEAENRSVRALQSEAVHELSGRLVDFIFGAEE